MQLMQALAVYLPFLIAAIVLLFAAIFKLGKEKGAGLIVAGATGFLLMGVIDPVVNVFVLPAVLEKLSTDSLGFAVLLYGFVSNVCSAVCVGLIAFGTFVRSPHADIN